MTAPEDVRSRIDAARRVLEARLDEDVPLDELASVAHYSSFHFHRLFRGVTGETVREHVRRLRLERAAHRLAQSDADILRVALDAGYASHEAFTRAFKQRFGVAPSAHREARREIAARTQEEIQEHAMEIRIERREASTVAYVRHVGPYDEVGAAWKALMKWGWMKAMFGGGEMFGLCYDDLDVTPRERVRYDACMVVRSDVKPKGAVRTKDAPAGTYAVALHEGAYAGIGATYARLFARVSSEAVGGKRWALGDPPSLEKYLNDPRKTPPEKLRTEVWAPVV